MEHVLTMANLKLKPSLFTPHPSEHVIITADCMLDVVKTHPVSVCQKICAHAGTKDYVKMPLCIDEEIDAL